MESEEMRMLMNRQGRAEKTPVGPEPFIGVSQQHVKVYGGMFSWSILTGGESKGRATGSHRTFIVGPDPGHRRMLSLGRNVVNLVVGLLTGYSTLRRHLALVGMVEGDM